MNLPRDMLMIEASGPGGPEVLRPGRGPVPIPKPGEVLVQVEAAGVNRPDVQQRRGLYPPPPDASPILGLEVAGKIVALGEGVDEWTIGDAVCALANGGGYAGYCAVPASQCLPYPAGYDATHAAALPENYFTVWVNVFGHGRLQTGESILIHGGTSGIGVTATKLAKAFGATVYTTAGSDEKCEACRRFGADAAINYRKADFDAEIERLTEGRGVDVILDMVGGDYTARNVKCLAPGGRLIIIGFMGGRVADGVDLTRIAARRLVITGSTLRPRSREEKAQIAHDLRQHVWPRLDAGTCGPEIYKIFALDEVAEAHRLMEESRHIGKIMLRVDGH
jgi:NADPH2:quinone reductase